MWGGKVNNYEDPRIFYLADIAGWCLASDDAGLEKIKKYSASGARYYLELGNQPPEKNETLYAWLHSMQLLYLKRTADVYTGFFRLRRRPDFGFFRINKDRGFINNI